MSAHLRVVLEFDPDDCPDGRRTVFYSTSFKPASAELLTQALRSALAGIRAECESPMRPCGEPGPWYRPPEPERTWLDSAEERLCEEGFMPIEDFIHQGAYVDAAGVTRAGPSPWARDRLEETG